MAFLVLPGFDVSQASTWWTRSSGLTGSWSRFKSFDGKDFLSEPNARSHANTADVLSFGSTIAFVSEFSDAKFLG